MLPVWHGLSSMNPYLARMGYGPDDRVLILHIDDMGFVTPLIGRAWHV